MVTIQNKPGFKCINIGGFIELFWCTLSGSPKWGIDRTLRALCLNKVVLWFPKKKLTKEY